MKQYFILPVFALIAITQQLLLVGAMSTDEFLTLTLSQKHALDKFRARIVPNLEENYMKQDTYLIRWLRARNFDVNSAEAMLSENLKWRKGNQIDNIRKEDWSDMSPDFHITLDTYDKMGQPIGEIDMNFWDIRQAILQGKGQRLLRFVTHLVENITGQVIQRQEKGMNVTQVLVLMNAGPFNVVQHACAMCLPLWVQFIQIMEDYYPGWLDEFIIVDSPQAIQIVLNTLKPFFSKSTRDAIKVFGPNKRKWLQYLDKKISKDERRKVYGGTKASFKY